MNRRVSLHGWSYSGIAWTNRDGQAVVTLPPFAELHHSGFEVTLEPVGGNGRATLLDEISDGRFTIATDTPHRKVAWRVTAYRDEEEPCSS
jgi:hypothetical protein